MPTLARGVAVVAVCACLSVLVTAGLAHQPRSAELPQPVCAVPVEIYANAARPRLGCADEAALQQCPGSLRAGDAVQLQDNACTRQPGGMRAGWRLLHGLKINLNRASCADLQLLDGVGPKTAARLVAYRTRVGRVGRLTDLRQVRGIGPKTLARLAPWLSLADD